MRIRRLAATGAAAAALLVAAAAPSWADSCANVSRAAPAGYTPGTTYSAPLIQGNWVWLPSLTAFGYPVDELPPIWGFLPPGGPDSTLVGAPGAAGNYTDGQTESLLGMSALCAGRGQVVTVRQTDHGIQTGCE